MRVSNNQHICGLYFTSREPSTYSWNTQRHYLPQVKLDSSTTITPVCYTTSLKQTFHNPGNENISQARYTFPLYDGVAVSSYTISYGEKTLKGIVQQKDVAKKTYEAAVDRGETAGLLAALPAGVFGVTLGNLPAKTDVLVDIVYCGELKHDAAIDGLRYMLPTSIAPRYGEYPGQLIESTATHHGGISITIDVDMDKSAIRKVQSPSHPIAVSMGALSTEEAQSTFNPSKASTTLTLGTTELAGDFVLQLLIDNISKPQALIEQHSDLPSRAIMATLVPKFVLDPVHPEIVFIADQSGSMQGSKNSALVSALKVFIKSLPIGVRFNICAFGTSYKTLWPTSQAYNEENMEAAIEFVGTFKAQYGGTNILNPVKGVFEQRLSDMPLEVMLLTDGEIWGEQNLFQYVEGQIKNKGVDARMFGLGIGSDVSHTLVEGIARAGNGFAQFVTQDEETDQKVIRMLKGALYPHLTDRTLEVEFHSDAKTDDSASDDEFELVEKVDYCLNIDDTPPAPPAMGNEAAHQPPTQEATSLFDPSADLDKPIQSEGRDRYAHLPFVDTPKILQAPSVLPSLFPFNRTIVYLILGPDAPKKPVSSITLRAKSPQGPLELTVNVSKTVRSTTVHQLAARKSIQELETGHGWLHAARTTEGHLIKDKHASRLDELVEREGVRLGERFQVASKWTSFVAIEDRPTGTSNEGGSSEPQVRHTIPSSPTLYLGMPSRAPKSMTSDASALKKKKKKKSAGRLSSLDPASPSLSINASSTSRSYHPAFLRQFQNVIKEAPTADWDQITQNTLGGANTSSAVPPPPMAAASMASRSGAMGAFGCRRAMPRGATSAQRFAAANFGGALQSTGMSVAACAAAPASEEEKEESDDDDDMGIGLFDDDDYEDLAVDACAQGASQPRAVVAKPLPLPDISAETGKKPVVHNLIGLQRFAGLWEWSDELLAEIQMKGRGLEFDGAFGSKNVMATALAVAYLETKLAASKDVWEMVVAKARVWMRTRVSRDEVEGLVAKARELL